VTQEQNYRQVMDRDDPNSEWGNLVNADLPEVLPESYSHEGEIVNRPSEDAPAPMKVNSLEFKGYVQCWDTRTGRLVLQPKWLLWQTMAKKRPDGSQVFTLTNPHIAPNYGADLKCPLNPASPEYQGLMDMGFKECQKSHIPNRAALNSHLAHSHKATFRHLEESRAERIRDEDRKLQQDMMAAMTQAAMRGVSVPNTVPNTVPETQSIVLQEGDQDTSSIVIPSRQNLFEVPCPDCPRTFNGKTKKQAHQKLVLHQRHCPNKLSRPAEQVI